MHKKTITGNFYNKYESKNLIEIFLVNRYKNRLANILSNLHINNCLEIGSGEGYILKILQEKLQISSIFGSDIDINLVLNNKHSLPNVNWTVNTAEFIPFDYGNFDLIIACEVLEHLKDPNIFLSECQRLGADYYIFTVPNEPLWRILNLIRFKYIKNLGNTPGHLNHWSKNQFQKFINRYLHVKMVVVVQPWIFLLAINK